MTETDAESDEVGIRIGGYRAMAVTSDRHGARLAFQSADEPSRFGTLTSATGALTMRAQIIR